MLKYSSQSDNRYSFVYTLRDDAPIGEVWQWVLYGEYRDKDFKWNGRTFYFNNQNDYLMFMLKWS